jgi:hypothetical protein
MNKDLLSVKIQEIINKNSLENGSNTPDFIIANFMVDSIDLLNKAIRRRDEWQNTKPPITKRTLVEVEGELKYGKKLLDSGSDEYISGVVATLSWILGHTGDQPLSEE